jgi:hypothetical protein
VASWNGKDPLSRAFDGDEWEMVGFEEGCSFGWPAAIHKMYRGIQQPYLGGTFRITFRFVSVRIFNKLHEPSEAGGLPLVDEDVEATVRPPTKKGPGG